VSEARSFGELTKTIYGLLWWERASGLCVITPILDCPGTHTCSASAQYLSPVLVPQTASRLWNAPTSFPTSSASPAYWTPGSFRALNPNGAPMIATSSSAIRRSLMSPLVIVA